MGSSPADLPEAADRRFGQGAFTSALTVPDFAACLQMGLEPLGYVQGFCVMQWQWYGALSNAFGPSGTGPAAGAYSESWQCPHGMVSAEHRSWGQNYEQSWLEDAWSEGFTSAYRRMLEETTALGGHGVVGVVDTTQQLSDMGVLEFRVQGTAVRVADAPTPGGDADAGAAGPPWTTYLAGQRLAKLIEAGYAPVSVAVSLSSVRIWASCITAFLTEGNSLGWGTQLAGQEIEQVVRAQIVVRRLARERVRGQLGGDALHGASLQCWERALGEGDAELQCVLRGNRVRRFKEFDPMPPPRPTVRLG